MNTIVRQAIAGGFLLALLACGGPTKKKDDPLVDPNDQAGESCCCRIETDDPEDPTFSRVGVMECSSRHGACLNTDTQCEGQPEPTPEGTDSNALPPTVEDTPTSF